VLHVQPHQATLMPLPVVVSKITHHKRENMLKTMPSRAPSNQRTSLHMNETATKPTLLRRALKTHQDWIETTLGAPFSDVVILEVHLDLTQIGAERLLACSNRPDEPFEAVSRLNPLLRSAITPEGFPPLVELNKTSFKLDLLSFLEDSNRQGQFEIEWQDCPIAMRLDGINAPVIAVNAAYHAGPCSDTECVAHLLVTKRECAAELVALLEHLDRRDTQPRLHTLGGTTREIETCEWNQLVLDQRAVSLLKDDFESFFERESWFREKRLPFRRGYLLHGPPGNGKSTAIRAMMSSRCLSAYTMRLFDRRGDDSTLDALFEKALKNRPALVLLEDLDRAFPKTGETRSNISVQQLLNCLDGVATGEGVIVVATANEPTILDPAILRRPGRFDRVVHFPNPARDLRQEYFSRIDPNLTPGTLKELSTKSGGLSFAQLRETYIMAGQRAFERKGEISREDLLSAIASLRESTLAGSRRNGSAGFQTPPSEVAV
jgi:ATPase family associated with various cellular activities (AAA)